MHSHDLRVIARIINTTIDETFISVLKDKLGQNEKYWETSTGAMLLAASNYFFKRGVHIGRAYKLATVVAVAFFNIDHHPSTPNINTEVSIAAKHVGLSAPELYQVAELLRTYFSAIADEKAFTVFPYTSTTCFSNRYH